MLNFVSTRFKFPLMFIYDNRFDLWRKNTEKCSLKWKGTRMFVSFIEMVIVYSRFLEVIFYFLSPDLACELEAIYFSFGFVDVLV